MSKKRGVYDEREPDETIFRPAEGKQGIDLTLEIYRVPEEEMPLEQQYALDRLRQLLIRPCSDTPA
jgi:hypothetical protein